MQKRRSYHKRTYRKAPRRRARPKKGFFNWWKRMTSLRS